MKNGSFVVIYKDDLRQELFLVFRSDFPVWNLTGGGIEEGESPEEAAVREAFEETGFTVKIVRKLGIYKVRDKNGRKVRNTHLYEGRKIRGEFIPEFSGCKGEWFNINNLPKDITCRTREKIADSVNYQRFFTKDINTGLLFANLSLMVRHPLSVFKYLWKKRLTGTLQTGR